MSAGRKIKTQDDFIAPARRALRRAARRVRTENLRLGLPLIAVKNGKASGKTRMNTEDVRKYAAEQGLAEEAALKKGMEEKSK